MEMNQLLTSVDALRFAIAFAQMNLIDANLRRLSNQLRDFFTLEPGLVGGEPYSRDELVNLQRDARKVFRQLLGMGLATADLKIQISLVRIGGPVAPQFLGPPGVLRSVNGTLRDRFLYRQMRLLEELGCDKIQTCPAPDCGRIFFKVTRKEFC